MAGRSPLSILPLLLILGQAFAPETRAATSTTSATISKVPLICVDSLADPTSSPASKWLTSCADAAKELLFGRRAIDPSTTGDDEGLKGAVKAHLAGVYRGSIPATSKSTLEQADTYQHSPVPVCVAKTGTLLAEVAADLGNPGVGIESTTNRIGHRCGDPLQFRFTLDGIEVASLIPLELEIENPQLHIDQNYKNNPTRVSARTPTRGFLEISRVNGLYAYAVDQTWKEFEAEILSTRGFALSAGFEALSGTVSSRLSQLNALWDDSDLAEQLLECGKQVTDALTVNKDSSGKVVSYERGAFQRQRADLACASWMGLRGTIFKLAQFEFYNRVKERMRRVGITPVADLRAKVTAECTPLQADGTISNRKMDALKETLERACGPMRTWRREEKRECLQTRLSRMINGSSNGAGSCYLPVMNRYFEEQYAKLEN